MKAFLFFLEKEEYKLTLEVVILGLDVKEVVVYSQDCQDEFG